LNVFLGDDWAFRATLPGKMTKYTGSIADLRKVKFLSGVKGHISLMYDVTTYELKLTFKIETGLRISNQLCDGEPDRAIEQNVYFIKSDDLASGVLLFNRKLFIRTLYNLAFVQ
jgi:hypothetical protein